MSMPMYQPPASAGGFSLRALMGGGGPPQMEASDQDVALWRSRIASGLKARSRLEPLWEECLAFAKGHQWVQYAGRHNRQLISMPNPRGIERATNDELTQYRLTLLGELELDDDRPQALFRQGEAPYEDYAEMANDAISYGWDEQWQGETVLRDARTVVIDVGTCPLRCYWDGDYGDYLPQEQPFVNGQMVSSQDAYHALDQGGQVSPQQVREGRICWHAGTPFNVVVPPNVHREHLFRWVVWVEVLDLGEMKARWPRAAEQLVADAVRDVARVSSTERARGLEGVGWPDTSIEGPGAPGDRQAFLYSCYENPSAKYPQGRVTLLGTKRMVPLESRESLDYRAPDGQFRSGIHFLHGIRVSDRFWSRGFMELGLSPQRTINRRITQINQTIDRAQPKVYVEEGSMAKPPEGIVLEQIDLRKGAPRPVIDPGMGPGPWMQQNIDANRTNLERAVLPDVSLGQNPPSVTTYSQLALLREQATRRLESLLGQHRETIAALCEDSVCDIRRYWGPQKLIQVAGTEGVLRAQVFNASEWPDYTKFTFATGSALPRSQGAQLQLIQDVFSAAVTAGVTMGNPGGWISWFHDSLQAGKTLDLPIPPGDPDQRKAQYENQLMMSGQAAQVDYFDNAMTHVPEHRLMQMEARMTNQPQLYSLVEQHIQQHLAIEKAIKLTMPGPVMPPMLQQGAAGPAMPPPPPPPAGGPVAKGNGSSKSGRPKPIQPPPANPSNFTQ